MKNEGKVYYKKKVQQTGFVELFILVGLRGLEPRAR